MIEKSQTIQLIKSVIIFITATAYFYLLLFTVYPFVKSNFNMHPAIYWFITGFFLFIPLFVCAVLFSRFEGGKKITDILISLNIKPMTKKDWIYAITATILVFISTGLIFGISVLLTKYFKIRELNLTPWFMEMSAFKGKEKLLLLVWLPMFFFNIVGEEILWRGYIQTRLKFKHSWLICSGLWIIFHLPFGLDMILIASPILLILPYVYSKTQNTLVGIFIHGIYNGPIFILVALGIIK